MNCLNNHFQKGVIIFVTLMILTIPNLCMYSFVGSYQTSSVAIVASNTYEPSHSEGKAIYLEAAILGIILGVAMVGGFITAVVLGVQKGSIANNNIDANYAKYDFSKFDN